MGRPKPTKGKKYSETENVYEAAKRRLRDIVETHDDVHFCFSGGKDSLVTLHLGEEVWKEMGRTDKIKVIFRDEEFIPDDVLEFVNRHRTSGKYDFRYFCLQLTAHKYVLGRKETVIQWDANRRHIRPMPDFAITDPRVMDQYTADAFTTFYDGKGSVCMITGIRAAEGLVRLRAIVNKPNRPHIASTETPGIHLGRPIYDWEVEDIFYYLWKNNIEYCKIYDSQLFSNAPLRVASYVTVETSKRYHILQQMYPVFFQQILDVFPDLYMQFRYYDQFDRHAAIAQYPRSWSGVFKYIEENIHESQQAVAKRRVLEAMKHRKSRYRDEPEAAAVNFGGYPILHVFKTIVDGNFKRVILPKRDITKAEMQYELQ